MRRATRAVTAASLAGVFCLTLSSCALSQLVSEAAPDPSVTVANDAQATPSESATPAETPATESSESAAPAETPTAPEPAFNLEQQDEVICAELTGRDASYWTSDPKMLFEGRRSGNSDPQRLVGPKELHDALSATAVQCLYGPKQSEWGEMYGYGEFTDANARATLMSWLETQQAYTIEQADGRDIVSYSDGRSTIHLSMSEIDVVYAMNDQSWSNIVNL